MASRALVGVRSGKAQLTKGRRRFLATVLVAVATLPATPSLLSGEPRAIFSGESIRRVVSATRATQIDPRSDWARVRRLAMNAEITVIADGQAPATGRLVSVDEAGLTLRQASTVTPMTFERASIREIRRLTPRRGSKLGAAIGVGAGAFGGFIVALNLAYKDCQGSCTGEKFAVGASLVGLPVAGGFAGYRLFGRPASVEVIYTR